MQSTAKQDLPYKVVSFYTPDELYSDHAANLIKSLDRFEIAHDISCSDDLGGWELTCAAKARFIYNKWKQSKNPIVWLDADATVEQDPVLFNSLDADFALHKWDGWQFASGTLYFGKTALAEKLLQQWVLRSEADPETWDQVHLQSAWCDVALAHDLKTTYLPKSYCQIFDTPEEVPPVIKHWQASRAKKKEANYSAVQDVRHTDDGIEARRLDKPWRTIEESFCPSEDVKDSKTYFSVEEALRKAIGSDFPVLEVGCGAGRLARLFQPKEYVGVDVDPHALIQARENLPDHKFRITDGGITFPKSKSLFCYAVLLYVSDEALPTLLKRISKSCKKVIIAEVMDQRLRRESNPPAFNRDPDAYIVEMKKLGYSLKGVDQYSYDRCKKEAWTPEPGTRLTIQTFQLS